MNKDTVAGKIQEVGGKARASVGHATGDSEGEARGRADQITGKIRNTVGKVEDKLS